jgi:PAS domain S-box-containing protein
VSGAEPSVQGPIHDSRPHWQRYGIALLSVALATLVTWLLRSVISETILIFYFGTVIFVGWFGGLGPGLLATALSLAVAQYFFIEPVHSLVPSDPSDLIPMVLFGVFAAMSATFSEQLRMSRQSERQRADELAELSKQLQEQTVEMEEHSAELEQQFEEAQLLSEELEQANTALAEHSALQARLAAIVESSRDSIVGTGLDGTILSWNPAAQALYGYTPVEAVGQHISLLTPPDRRAEIDELYHLVRQGETIELLETVRQTKSGRLVDVGVSVSPIREDNTIIGVAKIDRDITSVKRVERQQNTLAEATRRLTTTLDEREVIEALCDMLVPEVGDYCIIRLIDDKYEIKPVHWKHAADDRQQLLDELVRRYPDRAEPGSHVAEVQRRAHAQLCNHLGDADYQESATDDVHLELMRKVATRSCIIAPLLVRGSVIGTLTVAISDSSREYDNDDVHFLEEICRRAATVVDNARSYQLERAAREEAEEANQAKFEFLTRMSHELRTPLNAIAGYAQILELGVHGELNQSQVEAISRIQRNQRHLLSLINDVLNFAKLETGHVRFAFEDFSVLDVLTGLEPLIAPQVQDKKLQYSFETCPAELRAHADPEKLEQIILNLLSNAVKFTRDGGAIRLRCEHHGERVAVQVIDTGEGIAADKLDIIFDPFIQANMQYTRTKEGTGLGLSISRDLARKMGGDLTVESTVGNGSTFTVWLPVATERAQTLA